MNWFRRFMMGRYGGDQLSMALIILSLLISLAANLTRLPVIAFISYIPLLIGVYRIFSRNIEKRRMENYKFAIMMSPVYSRIRKIQSWAYESKTNRRFRCPNCKTWLWVPKGKGTIIIHCPICKTKFEKRT